MLLARRPFTRPGEQESSFCGRGVDNGAPISKCSLEWGDSSGSFALPLTLWKYCQRPCTLSFSWHCLICPKLTITQRSHVLTAEWSPSVNVAISLENRFSPKFFFLPFYGTEWEREEKAGKTYWTSLVGPGLSLMLYFVECLRIQVQTRVSSLCSHPGAVDHLCLWDSNHLKDGLINYDPKSFVSCLGEP